MHAQSTAAGQAARLTFGQKQIRELLKQKHGEAFAADWERRQLNPQNAEAEPTAAPTPIRRPKEPSRALPVPVGATQAAEALLAHVTAGELTPSARHVYRCLLEVALEVARVRGYAAGVTSVAVHLPTELVSLELGMARSTLNRYLPELKAVGLVDQRGHATTHRGKVVRDGSVWRINVAPHRTRRARLRFEDLKHRWRNLTNDVDHGRTVYAWMKERARFSWVGQSLTGKRLSEGIKTLVGWALKPGALGLKTPLLALTVRATPTGEPYALLDAVSVPVGERRVAVDAAARAVAAHLQDDSIGFYRQVVWQLLRRLDGGEDRVSAVYHAVIRAGVDAKEGFARRPGALFTARLKEAGLLQWLRQTPKGQVGSVPLAA